MCPKFPVSHLVFGFKISSLIIRNTNCVRGPRGREARPEASWVVITIRMAPGYTTEGQFWWARVIHDYESGEWGWSQSNGVGTGWSRKGQALSKGEKKRASVQRNNLDRSRIHLSGKLQGNRQRRASHGTNGLVHMTAQFGMTKDSRAGPSACCLGFKWPH